MIVLDAGNPRAQSAVILTSLDGLDLSRDDLALLSVLLPGSRLRPIQRKALCDFGILRSRRNLVVSSPTNSGKSLIGTLLLLDALRKGRRAILVEPLRALAYEKSEDMREQAGRFPEPLGAALDRTKLCTGDYRLEDEGYEDPPPGNGELVVATAERLDSILRNPSCERWVESIGAVVIDEAHLLGSARRGPTLEFVIAVLRSLAMPPRIALLSATIGEPERLAAWLDPCDLIATSERTPALRKSVIALAEGEDPNIILGDELDRILRDPENSVLVFVYQRSSAEHLCRMLGKRLKSIISDRQIEYYHSGLSIQHRNGIRSKIASGQVRCCITTTALALGVNFPATHVFVRDTQFFGHGPLQVGELLQMLGRAGRGDTEGSGVVMVRPSDPWEADELSRALAAEKVEPVRSSLAEASQERVRFRVGQKGENSDLVGVATLVAATLARFGVDGATEDALANLLGNTLAGPELRSRVPEALAWLEDPTRALAYQSALHAHRLTVLGERGARSMLPLPFAAGIGQLLRDLLDVDPGDRVLAALTRMDHLLLICLLAEHLPDFRRFSGTLAEQVDGWFERQSAERKSVLFRQWVGGAEAGSRASQLLNSLQIEFGGSDKKAYEMAYRAALHAILLEERSVGCSVPDLERQWKLRGLDGVEERWRDTFLWLAGGLARLYDLRCVYHHLEEAGSDSDRVARVKDCLRRARRLVFDVQERMKYCSPLGPMLLGVRRSLREVGGQRVGIGTIRRLEEAGLTSLPDVVARNVEELVELGLQRKFAVQIHRYLRARQR